MKPIVQIVSLMSAMTLTVHAYATNEPLWGMLAGALLTVFILTSESK